MPIDSRSVEPVLAILVGISARVNFGGASSVGIYDYNVHTTDLVQQTVQNRLTEKALVSQPVRTSEQDM